MLLALDLMKAQPAIWNIYGIILTIVHNQYIIRAKYEVKPCLTWAIAVIMEQVKEKRKKRGFGWGVSVSQETNMRRLNEWVMNREVR